MVKKCMYCNRKIPQVQSLEPVYDSITGKLDGYYCEDHIGDVRAFNRQQKERLDQYLEGQRRKQP